MGRVWNKRRVALAAACVVLAAVLCLQLSHDNPFGQLVTPISPLPRAPIAVCITGNTRTFRYQFVHASILQNIIKPLQEEAPVNVFFVVRLDDDSKMPQLEADRNDNQTMAAIRKFHPVDIMKVADEDEIPQTRLASPLLKDTPRRVHRDLIKPPSHCPSNASTPLQTMRTPFALYRSKQCLHRIHHYERHNHMRHSWVYRLRPDVVMQNPIRVPSQLRQDTFYTDQGSPTTADKFSTWWKEHTGVQPRDGPVFDHVQMASRVVADVAYGAYHILDKCATFSLPFRQGSLGMLWWWLLQHATPHAAIPMQWFIVREHVGPECDRLAFMHGDKSDAQKALVECFKFAEQVREHFPDMPSMNKKLLRTVS